MARSFSNLTGIKYKNMSPPLLFFPNVFVVAVFLLFVCFVLEGGGCCCFLGT